jgi:hypothetical protein
MRSVAPANAGFSIVAGGVKRALNATRRRDGFVASTSESLLRASGCWSAASVSAAMAGGSGEAKRRAQTPSVRTRLVAACMRRGYPSNQ